jgi:hypothetical protein
MTYDGDDARAFPKPIDDPAHVDDRRADMGMEPLVHYVNDMCRAHYEMNRARYAEKRIPEPYQYPSGFTDW